MTDEVQVKFSGDVSGLAVAGKQAAAEIDKVAAATKGAASQATGAWTQVGSSFKGTGDVVKQSLDQMTNGMSNLAKGSEQAGATTSTSMTAAGVAIGSVLASAATEAFKKITELLGVLMDLPRVTSEFVRSTADVARELGTSAQAAYVFSNSAGDVGAGANEASRAIAALSMKLRENEADLVSMGVVTRSASGALLDQQTIFYNAIETVNSYKEGTDRNTAASEIFGRSVTGTSRILEMSREATAANSAEISAYGDIITGEVLQANDEYIAATNRLNNAKGALSHQIGFILIPVFTEFKNMMAGAMPAAMNFLKGVVGSLTVAFWGLSNGVTVVWNIVGSVLSSIVNALGSVAMALAKIATGDFSGAWKAIAAGGARISDSWSTSFSDIVKSSENAAAKIKAVWQTVTGTGTAAGGGGEGGRDFVPPPAAAKKGRADPSTTSAELALLKAQFKAESDLEQEALRQSEAAYADYYRNNIITASQYFEVKTALEQNAIDIQMGNLKRQQAELAVLESSKGLEDSERLKIKTQEAQIEGELAVLELKRMGIALRNAAALTDAEQRLYEQLERIRISSEKQAGEGSLEQERQILDQKKAMHLISQAEYLEGEMQLEVALYNIKLKALEDELILADTNLVRKMEVNQQLEELERQHQLALTGIKNQAELERNQYVLGAMNSIQQGVAQNLQQMMLGQKSLAQGLQGIWSSVLSSITAQLAKFAAEWIIKKIMMMAFGKAAAVSEVGTAAALAGANGVASWALAPWPINIGAPAFGAAMFASAMAFGAPAAAAEGGFDVGAVGPITQLHPREMVLPQKHADVIRGMADGGGPRGDKTAAPSAGQTTNYVEMTVVTKDSDSFRANTDQITAEMHQRLADLQRDV